MSNQLTIFLYVPHKDIFYYEVWGKYPIGCFRASQIRAYQLYSNSAKNEQFFLIDNAFFKSNSFEDGVDIKVIPGFKRQIEKTDSA